MSQLIAKAGPPTAPIVMLLASEPEAKLFNPVTDPEDAPFRYAVAPPVPSSATDIIVALAMDPIVKSFEFSEYHLKVFVK
jgi:hypothetical protein